MPVSPRFPLAARAARPAARRGTARPGSVLLSVLFVLTGLGTAVFIFFLYQALAIKMIQARNVVARMTAAAEGADRVMLARLVTTAEAQLGQVTQADLDSLQTTLATIPVPDGVALDTLASSYMLVRVDSNEVVPADVAPLVVTTDQPRFRFTVPPLVKGTRAGQTVQVRVTATVTSAHGGRRSVTAVVAISKVQSVQDAVLAQGDLELCVSSGSSLVVSGDIRALGAIRSICDGSRSIAGGLRARDSLVVSGAGSQQLVWDGGNAALASLTRTGMEGAVDQTLTAYHGRVRLDGALGEELVPTAVQDSVTAGSGECPDFSGACAGTSSYFPSLEVQRTVAGPTAAYDLRCGYAYGGGSCATAGAAITYVPFPYTSAQGPRTTAWVDTATGRFWQGLLPDFRRKPRCDASMGGASYRTFRCPTNAYGFVIDLAQLPAIPGGLLSIRKSTNTINGFTNPSGYQEVALVKNATQLAGALTIHSEVPVYVVGSYNTVTPKPSRIDAPLITVLPADFDTQLASAAFWDSTAFTTPRNLVAHQSVVIHAVLRAPFTPTTGGAYYGGVVEQIPSVLGDWRNASVEVDGAVIGVAVASTVTGSYATQFPGYNAPPSPFVTYQPLQRRIQYDATLATVTGMSPGSWTWTNLPSAGAGGTRTVARQRHATGGATVVRLVQDFVAVP